MGEDWISPSEMQRVEAEARRLVSQDAAQWDGLEVPSWSAMWPQNARAQRLGVIRLEWLTGKRAKLHYVPPTQTSGATP